MNEIFLYLFLVSCGLLIFKVISQPNLVYEYPYFIGFIFFIFIAPQAIIIYNQPRLVPPSAIGPLFLMCFLSVLMAVLGYKLAPAIRISKSLNVRLNEKKLINISIIYTLLGYLFLFLMNRHLSQLKTVSTQWSGILTIYVLLFNVINIAFPVFLYLTLQKFSFRVLSYTIIAGLPSLYFIIAAGRRETTALFFLTIALTFFFKARIAPSKLFIIGAVLFATLIIPATGDYRKVAADHGPIEAIKSLDLKQGFINYFESGKYLELVVAAHIIDAYSFHGEYDYGSGYWDNMVFRYVPAQILGNDFKQSLMINSGSAKFINGYRAYTGLTTTGVGDSFTQFGYLGCFFFFFLGGFFRELWRSALNTSSPLIQILYIMCMVQGLLSVTHATINFVPGIFFSYLCLRLVAAYAKIKE
jgi:hypothetical protein